MEKEKIEEKTNGYLDIYNKCKDVPEEAKKIIQAGRLKGMTDIKPMWRIEKLTEMFGPCGFGWKTIIKNKEIIEGANNTKIAIVDIDLFIKVDGVWSDAIEGTGGSSFISQEKSGLYTSDECFKMAYTDALSVACKSIGIGANVYWGDSKYDKKEENKNEDPKKVLTNREQLIQYCAIKKLDTNEVSKKYNLTKSSTEDDYKTALLNLKLESGE